MRKIIAFVHLSLDGVMQGPGGADEDRSDGFDCGGWTWQFSDEKAKASIIGLVGSSAKPNDLLLGRKTYDNFASFWPIPQPTTLSALLLTTQINMCVPTAIKSWIGPRATSWAASTS